MAWSYRKRIKIIPGVHLNFSKSGISTSIGVRGASINFGKNGTYLNSSIPGIGLYSRSKIFEGPAKPQPMNLYNRPELPADNIFSADIQEITSQDMQGIKEAILAAQEQKEDLKNDLEKIKKSLVSSRVKLTFSYIFLYGLIARGIPRAITFEILQKTEAIARLAEQIENCYVNLDIEFEPEIGEKYHKVIESFKKLSVSTRIWDVTSENSQNKITARSAASVLVNKREVRFGIKTLPGLQSKFETLWLRNANGADLYFYPSFIVMYSSPKTFALIGLNEINLFHRPVRFIETGLVPADSRIIDKTWAKVNKNGTPDKRFRDNYQIPIVRYGEISLTTSTGLHEQYEFSNYESSEEFAWAFNNYQLIIRKLNLQ